MKEILSISLDKNLFSKKSTDSYDRHLYYAKRLKKLTMIVYTKKNYSIINIGNLSIIPTNSRNFVFGFLDFLKILKGLKKNNEKFDVVTTQDPFFLGLIGLKATKLFKAKLRPQLHIEVFESPYWRKESFLNLLQYFAGFYIIKKMNMIRVVSKRSQSFFDRNKMKSYLIPVATNLKKFINSSNKKKDIDLIFVGRLVKQKHLFFFLEIIYELKQKHKDIRVLLVGDGLLRKKLELKAKRLQLTKNVEFIGYVKHIELNELYNRAKIFVLPSLYEGWGLVAIEASLVGLPVVMGDTGCAGEVIINEYNGYICKINSKNDFVLKIDRLLQDEDLYNRFNKNSLLYKNNLELNLRDKWIDFLNQ